LRLTGSAIPEKQNTATGKKSAEARPLEMIGSALAFTQLELYINSRVGVVHCKPNGTCTPVKAFSRRMTVQALWVNESGSEAAVVAEGKLGLSKEGAFPDWYRGVQERFWLVPKAKDYCSSTSRQCRKSS